MADLPKVLIVDDESKIIIVMKKMLVRENYEVLSSTDADEVLDILEEKAPVAVVLTDNRMPTMRGTELLEKVKMYFPDTIRMLMTAHYDPQLVEDVVNKGEVFRYMKKPLDFKVVKKVLEAGIDQYKENLKAKELGKNLEKLSAEKTQLKNQSSELDGKIQNLQKSKKTLVLALVMAFLCFGSYQAYVKLSRQSALTESSVTVGHWVKYNDGTAKDLNSDLVWMIKDFRLIEKRQPKSWDEAMAWTDKVNASKFAGFSDWRVPSIEELQATYDPARTRMAFDQKKDFPVGYPEIFENGGGYGYWSSQQQGATDAKYFFFLGGYSKVEDRGYNNAVMSVRLVRGG